MHSLYFVRLAKEEAENSMEARAMAQRVLDENSFASEGGFYSTSKADWYVIGGRWSGLFADRERVNGEIQGIIKEEIESSPKLLDYLYCNSHLLAEEKRKEIDSVSMNIIGVPYFRDTYMRLGYDDDANIITKKILEKLHTDEYKDVEVAVIEKGGYLSEELLASSLGDESAGDWIITVDYHS